jgi:L-alanine-DL-glutamate epimerase-like enolase superfamily enzyme
VRGAIPKITAVTASAYTIPTDAPEADGTLSWDRTTLVLAEVTAGGKTGLGYTYAHDAAATLIQGKLAEAILGSDAFAIAAAWQAMLHAIRNLGRPGLVATAISAVDVALWDLKAKLLDLPLVVLLGAARETVPVYGSGGFTSYPVARLQTQLAQWAEQGARWVKMKVGSDPAADAARAAAARDAIGSAQLFVDANGAYDRKQALAFAERFAELGVRWFEEPVSSDDLDGLRLLRDRAPAGMRIAAGEYGYDAFYFRRMLEAGAVDVLQADATRCLGITGFLAADALCDARSLPLSSHCAPALHLHAALAAKRFWNVEWFHDHVRIEAMLFDGAPRLADGLIRADLARPGLGLAFKRADAARYAVKRSS